MIVLWYVVFTRVNPFTRTEFTNIKCISNIYILKTCFKLKSTKHFRRTGASNYSVGYNISDKYLGRIYFYD